MFEQRLHHHVDWSLLAAVLALALIGITQIYSATGGWTPIVQTQIYGVVLGLVAYFVLRSRAPEKLTAVGQVLAEDEDSLSEGKLVSGPVHAG